jgi:hypothetical protein
MAHRYVLSRVCLKGFHPSNQINMQCIESSDLLMVMWRLLNASGPSSRTSINSERLRWVCSPGDSSLASTMKSGRLEFPFFPNDVKIRMWIELMETRIEWSSFKIDVLINGELRQG